MTTISASPREPRTSAQISAFSIMPQLTSASTPASAASGM